MSIRRSLCVPLLLALASSVACGNAPKESPDDPVWKPVDKLISDQKMDAAEQATQKILDEARAAQNEQRWSDALIRWVQLETSLHGSETAVRKMRDTPWPKGLLPHTALELFYASTLVNYLRMYSWEIGQREQLQSKGPIDLKKWTHAQIFAEAEHAYAEVWQTRDQLGAHSVKALAPWVAPNDYPNEVRSTLRDAVSYFAVELLADSTDWTAQQSNETYRLSLAKLLQNAPDASAKLKLDDPAPHPIEKLTAVLDDLEAWQTRAGRKEAALEARLERERRLSASFSSAEERALIRKDLKDRLPGYRGVPWWSMGMAELAEMTRQSGDLVLAKSIADEGAKAYPGSHGGKRCRLISAEIAAPNFSMNAMLSDGPKKRSIKVDHKNVEKLWFRAYPFDLVQRITSAKDYNLLPNWDEEKLIISGKPAASWSVSLPATPDFRDHATFVTPPLVKTGAYVIAASTRESFSLGDGGRVLALNFIVTNLVIVTRADPSNGGLEVSVLDGEGGQPVPGATVTLYQYDWRSHHTAVDEKTTNERGQLSFSGHTSNSHFLLAHKGGDLSLNASYFSFYRESSPPEQTGSLVYTDRSIYRPQQKILWKMVGYRGRSDLGRFQVVTGTRATVQLVDPNGQTVASQEVTTNRYGSASGEFLIPTGRLLGGWTVRTTLNGATAVRVEEYKRPTFEVSLKDPTSALRLNKPATLTGEAKYYFGLPVTEGRVKYRVTRAPVYPAWWWWWYRPSGGSEEQTIAQGVSALKADGTFEVKFVPAADERGAKKGISYSYSVACDLTDEGGETRSAERSFRLGFTTVEAQIGMDTAFMLAGQPGAISFTRTNLDGAPRPGNGDYRIVALKQPAKTLAPADQPLPQATADDDGGAASKVRTPGDALRDRASPGYSPEQLMAGWTDGDERQKGALSHDAKGLATLKLPALAAGAYRVRYHTVDDFGAPFETWRDLVVADGVGKRTPLQLPVLLDVEKSSVKVGDKARLLALSGLDGQPLWLDRFRDGKLVDRKKLGPQDGTLIEIPVADADRGGFAFTLWGVRDHQLLEQNGSVFVPWDDKQLQVELTTFRDKIRPGQRETWRITVKGAGAEAGAAELLAYMYDRSLDLFVPHSPPSPMSLYPSHARAGGLRANLSSSSASSLSRGDWYKLPEAPGLTGDSLTFIEGYGIGGMGYRNRRGMMMFHGGPGRGAPDAAPAPPPAQAAAPVATATEKAPAREEAKSTNDKRADDQTTRGPASGKSGGAQAPVQVRSNFSETAFWQPHLQTDGKGQATIEFTAPDSVTAWNVWVHAVTRDLRSGSTTREAKTVKELMVRPYLPRFFREGDRADLKVVVNNASDHPLSGTLEFDVLDPESQKPLNGDFQLKERSHAFTVPAGGSTDLTFPVLAPKRVGVVAFKAVARSGNLSDGELRPLPVLPGRMHLAQSRFVTLKDKDKRVMTFPDLAKSDDPSRVDEQMVVTLDAQLFFTVLKALPYLIHYPYECAEQTLNRFVSTGIVSSLYTKYPQVAKMAQQFSSRQTPLEPWDAGDPNRRMTLEESPWLTEARGGDAGGLPLVDVLDQRIARASRDEALDKLRKMQTASGAFPWFPGGPPSPYMTLYMMYGFAKAAEYKVDLPKEMVQRGWQYLAQHYRSEYIGHMRKGDADVEFITFLNFVASSYPDATYTGSALTEGERKEMLAYSFKRWKHHSPYLKGMLALTLKRMGRPSDAKLVFDSVMDSAKTAPDQGTFWAREDRSWLWYEDTIESHAFALRVLTELKPKDARSDGLVLWLLLNKKLNQWKSTRATAEVIYALVHYLEGEGALGIKEEATVSVGPRKETFTFEPDRYVGKTQLVLPGPNLGTQSSSITVEKATKGVMFASATWHFSTEKLPTEERGDFFNVSRAYFRRTPTANGFTLQPLAEGAKIQPGDQIEVQISLRSKHPAEYVHLRDPRAAGLEPENAVSQFKWDLGIGWYEETRDSGSNFFFEALPQGEYTFKYRLRANLAGTFRVGPAQVESMYAPEFTAYSTGAVLTVAK